MGGIYIPLVINITISSVKIFCNYNILFLKLNISKTFAIIKLYITYYDKYVRIKHIHDIILEL